MIKLNNLLNEETFTATNKKTGKTSVFKSKDSRDSAIKAGTHSKADGKGGDDSKKASTPTANIFNTPAAEPKADTPTSEPKKKRPGNPKVNKDAKKLAEKSGITPQKLGNEKYKEAMFQAAVSALTDSNFHSEARELVAAIEGKPEFAKKPEYPSIKDPKYKEKMDDIRKNSADGSVYMNGTGEIDDYGTDVSQASGWDGVDAADGIAFTLRMNGFHKEADLIQSVFDNKPYMKNEGRISLTKMVKEGKFKEDDLVYNKRTKTVGIVRMGDDKSGEVKTDADGNVNVDELEKYNPIKNKHQQNAKVAPSTEKEVNSRGLFNPFKSESIKLGNLLEISSIDGLNDILNGQSSQIEGIKISKGMAEHIIYWMRTSPYGKKYNSWVKKNSISTILPIAFNWGLDRGLESELKSEFTALKAKYGKAVKKENTK
jgi:hypothetical protein